MSFRRMLPFLLLNILVSAAVVIVILWWWEGQREETADLLAEVPIATIAVPTEAVDALVSPPDNETSAEAQLIEEVPSGPEVHIVGAGETLGQISVRYDVSMEDLMATNGMSNPNFLFVGQELIIPGTEPQEEAEEDIASEAETEADEGTLPTPIPTALPTEGEAEISIAEVIGAGEVPLEAIQIINNGSREASLLGWKLADQFGNFYTFGPITLFGEGAGILVHTTAGQDNATDLFWGQEESLWNSGDKVILYDADGAVQAEFEVP